MTAALPVVDFDAMRCREMCLSALDWAAENIRSYDYGPLAAADAYRLRRERLDAIAEARAWVRRQSLLTPTDTSPVTATGEGTGIGGPTL